MTVIHNGNQQYIGLSSDTKPTGVASGVARFTELNTQTDFIYNGSAWIPMGASGATTFEFGTSVPTGAGQVITALSGGTQMPSVSGFSFLLRNLSGNGTMHIGSTTNPPNFVNASGIGIPIYGGDSINVKLNNLNLLRVITASTTSGQVLSYLALST